MTSDSWQQVKELFEAALDRGPTERAAFLAQACAGDEEIRQEVESLLAAHYADSGFMNTPVGNLLVGDKLMLATGQHFGPYEEISPLGEGGMGQVYLAVDTRLGRKVALKLLPSSYTGDADRVRRFEQEARAASALNHPNIVTIHEIGQTDSLHFIATEFVDGETLREHMTTTRMTLGEVLDIATQIASALQAAHEAGIVHRDIKPENIMLRRDGFVKVLDFGLAKLAERGCGHAETQRLGERLETAVSASRRPLVSVSPKTDPGVVMGTAAYMSPEQARGAEVDARSDIWSLGVVLYEMVTGHAPFLGETPSHVIVSILESTPARLSLAAEVPAELERIVLKALCKETAERYQTAGEMARHLRRLKEELEVEARVKRELQPNLSGREFPARTHGFAVAEFPGEPAGATDQIIPRRWTASVEYFVGEIKGNRTYAAAALLVLLVGAFGLTYLATKRSKTNLKPRDKNSIAVLPLKPINAANRDELYEFGIADSLIHRLSSMKAFFVRPLSATRKYAGVEQDPLAAGREQQVDYVLASNYQIADGKIRVTAQLLNVASGQIEETRIIEQEAGNIFETQDAIASGVEKLLRPFFVTASDTSRAERGTTSEEAYLLVVQGKNLMTRRNYPVDAQKAVEYFEKAIRLDPNYALAYALMAHALHTVGTGGVAKVENEKAKEAVKKALELDNNLAEAYAVRGKLNFAYEYDFVAAEKDLLRAIELAPNNDSAHWAYALVSAYRGHFEDAMAEIETALAIDPNSLIYQRDRGRIFYYARRYDEAIVQLQRVIEVDENFGSAHDWLWIAYETKGDYATVYSLVLNFYKRKNPNRAEALQKQYETGGWQEVRRKQLEDCKLNERKFEGVFFDCAILCGQLGEKDRAFEYLNKAVEGREWSIVMLKVLPTLDPLRDDRRFDELVRRIGLE